MSVPSGPGPWAQARAGGRGAGGARTSSPLGLPGLRGLDEWAVRREEPRLSCPSSPFAETALVPPWRSLRFDFETRVRRPARRGNGGSTEGLGGAGGLRVSVPEGGRGRQGRGARPHVQAGGSCFLRPLDEGLEIQEPAAPHVPVVGPCASGPVEGPPQVTFPSTRSPPVRRFRETPGPGAQRSAWVKVDWIPSPALFHTVTRHRLSLPRDDGSLSDSVTCEPPPTPECTRTTPRPTAAESHLRKV